MRCPNCNSETDDNAKICPTCGTDLHLNAHRCPMCFVRLENGTSVCPNCGCNINESVTDEVNANSPPSLSERISQMSTPKKAGVCASFVAVLALVIFAAVAYSSAQKRQFADVAREYIDTSAQCMETIDALAEEYNGAYDGKWLVQSENTQSIEKEYADDISDVRQSRDTLKYLSSKMQNTNVSAKEKAIANDVCQSYNKCYLYVVEKQGKYPGYMTGYEKLKKDFDNAVKNLENNIEK